MTVPFPLVLVTAGLVLGLALAVIVVGWRSRALGPGVFVLVLGVAGALFLAATIFTWLRR